jgi:site-specific DNA-methyltransferase (adenine-specific)
VIEIKQTGPGPLVLKDAVTLVHGDCLEDMDHLLPGSVHIVITSPPYNIGAQYSTYSDDIPRAYYLDWIQKVVEGIKRVLHRDGSFFLNLGNKPSDQWFVHDVLSRLRASFHLQNTIHWVKAITVQADGKPLSVGHYKPINSNLYLNNCHEYVFHFTHTGQRRLNRLAVGVPYVDKSNLTRWAAAKDQVILTPHPAEGVRCRGNTWFVPYKTIQRRDKDRPHPATFPVELAEMCLKIASQPDEIGAVVLDPFMGIGTTALAVQRMHRGMRVIGFDVDLEYLKEAARRLEGAGGEAGEAEASSEAEGAK